MEYPDSVRARMVRRMLGPGEASANALGIETGIPQSTLSRWLRAAATIKGVSSNKPTPPPTCANASVENSLAHLSRRLGPRARYRCARSNLYDVRRAAVVQNLETVQRRLKRKAA